MEENKQKDYATIYCIIQLAFIGNVFPDLANELQKIVDETEDIEECVDKVTEMTNSAILEVCLLMKWGKTFCFYGSKGKAGRTKAYDTHCGEYRAVAVFSSLDSSVERKIHAILNEHIRWGNLYGKGGIYGEKAEFYTMNRDLWRFLIYLIKLYNKGKGRKDLMFFIDNVYNVHENFSNEPNTKLCVDCAGIKLSSVSDECLMGCYKIRKNALELIKRVPGIMPKIEDCIKIEFEQCSKELSKRQLIK